MTTDFELYDSPSDGISRVQFHPQSSDLLLATSWDGSAYVYSVSSNRTRAKLATGTALLDGCFSGSNNGRLYVGGLSQQLLRLDTSLFKQDVVGQHGAPIKAVSMCSSTMRVFTGSWDATVRAWDDRATTSAALTTETKLPDKVYSMDLVGNSLLVAMANRHVHLYDTRKPDTPVQRRESSLKYQTRCVRLFPDATGFVCSSIEGRVAVEWIEATEAAQAKKYAFKCHREPVVDAGESAELVYPVNALAFHPLHGTFATGGADGVVSVWDAMHRKRVKQLQQKYRSPVSSLSFSPDGRFLAVAASYGYEEGEKDHDPDVVHIHIVDESDVRPKA